MLTDSTRLELVVSASLNVPADFVCHSGAQAKALIATLCWSHTFRHVETSCATALGPKRICLLLSQLALTVSLSLSLSVSLSLSLFLSLCLFCLSFQQSLYKTHHAELTSVRRGRLHSKPSATLSASLCPLHTATLHLHPLPLPNLPILKHA